jgi:hypothetical protein
MKIEGSASGSGSISQRHESPDPDPPQNVVDPQHCVAYVPVCPVPVPTFLYVLNI